MSRHAAGDLLLFGSQRVRVQALCLQATHLTVSEGSFEGGVQLQDDDFTADLPLDAVLIESLFGSTAAAFEASFHSEDKPTRKAAKAAAKAANSTLKERSGIFLLGNGLRGLTVCGLPATSSSADCGLTPEPPR